MIVRDTLQLKIGEHERQLAVRFGQVIGGKDLTHLLGYRTPAAFRQAAKRKRLPFPTFPMFGRRGQFARLRDVATFLARLDLAMEESAATAHAEQENTMVR